MAVAGSDIDTAPVAHQAGQTQAAADLQHTFARQQGAAGHALGQLRARRPQQAEEGPGGR